MNARLKHLEGQDWLKLAQHADWSVHKLANLCKVSVRGLELHFHKFEGKTPKHWLVEQRQKLGMELLRNGLSVKETSVRLAYKHANHFSREFKKHWDYCPTKISLTETEARILRVLV